MNNPDKVSISITPYGLRWRIQFFIGTTPYSSAYALTRSGAVRKARRMLLREEHRKTNTVWYNPEELVRR